LIQILNEFNNRQSKAKNLIVFNFPEHKLEDFIKLSDTAQLNVLFKDINLNLSIIIILEN